MFEFAWEKVYGFTPEKTDKFVKKRKGRIYFRSRCRAAQEPQQAVFFSGENENGKGGETSTKS